jgi:hypothetical protein
VQRLRGFLAAMILTAMATSAGSPVLAHHSGAMFDRTQTVELAGVVKQYVFTNPHVWIEMLVPDTKKKGREVQWSIEGEGPAIMARMGLGPSVLKVGDKVKIRAHPLRDGRPGGSFIEITLPNGKVIAPPKRLG